MVIELPPLTLEVSAVAQHCARRDTRVGTKNVDPFFGHVKVGGVKVFLKRPTLLGRATDMTILVDSKFASPLLPSISLSSSSWSFSAGGTAFLFVYK